MRPGMSASRVERVSIRVPSDLRYGEAARAMLDALTRRLEQETETPSLNAHVISAFSEAYNNVVEHAYHGRRTGAVDVSVEVASEGLTVCLTDEGDGFDMEGVDEPDLDALPEGGLGLLIIRSLMTRVGYERGDRNVLTMFKEFARPLAIKDDVQTEL
jgi:serine/threonine-protein kinase RsbW